MLKTHFHCCAGYLIPKLTLATILFLSVPEMGYATTTVGMLHQGTLYLASDSKVFEDPVAMCKIHQIGRLYYTEAGLLDNHEYNFSVPDTIRRAYKSHPGIRASFDDFTSRIQPLLIVYFNRWSKADPARKRRLSQELNVSVTFAGFESDNSATLCAARLVAVPPFIPGSFRVKLEKRQCNNSTDPAPHNMNLLVGGETEGYEQCKTYSSIDPVAIEKCIVEKEIGQHKVDVGPPISILEISLLGSRWVSQGVCPTNPSELPTP